MCIHFEQQTQILSGQVPVVLFTNNTQAGIWGSALGVFLHKTLTTFLDHRTVAFALHSEKTETWIIIWNKVLCVFNSPGTNPPLARNVLKVVVFQYKLNKNSLRQSGLIRMKNTCRQKKKSFVLFWANVEISHVAADLIYVHAIWQSDNFYKDILKMLFHAKFTFFLV